MLTTSESGLVLPQTSEAKTSEAEILAKIILCQYQNMSESKHRNVCFTWNNYPPDYMQVLSKLPTVTYLVTGREIGESGTAHIQGYVEFKNQVRFSTLKKRLPSVHFEERKGTSQQAADYCKKDADYIETGTLSRQGKRNDLDEVREILKTGGERDVVDCAKSVHAVRFAQMYLKVREKKRHFKPEVIWLFGEAGTGKTSTAMYDAWRRGYRDDVHLQSGQGKWWEGYDAHKAVIIDDLRADFFSYPRALNIFDRYECRVENKGGSRQLLSRVIYVTCPWSPECVWSTHEEYAQLERRIDVILEILSNGMIVHKGYALSKEKPEDYPQDDTEEIEGSDVSKEVCEASDAKSGDETVVGT